MIKRLIRFMLKKLGHKDFEDHACILCRTIKVFKTIKNIFRSKYPNHWNISDHCVYAFDEDSEGDFKCWKKQKLCRSYECKEKIRNKMESDRKTD